MKKCTVCGITLTASTLGIKNILNKEERDKLKKIRLNNGHCSECAITLLLLELI